MSSLPQKLKDYVTDNTSRWSTPMVAAFRKDNKVMSRYWRVGHEPDFGGVFQRQWDEYLKAGSVARGAMLSGIWGEDLKRLVKKQSKERLRARGAELKDGELPTADMIALDRALVRWYDYGAQTDAGKILENSLIEKEIEAINARRKAS